MRPALLARALPVRRELFTVLLELFLLRWWRWQCWGRCLGRRCRLPTGQPGFGQERAGLGGGRLGTGAQMAERRSHGDVDPGWRLGSARASPELCVAAVGHVC